MIRERGPISRTEIQAELGLSFPAISLAVADLVQEGLVIRSGSTGSGVGRKAELFEFNPRKGYVMGIDLGARKIRVALANLVGNIVHKAEVPTLAYEGGPRVMARLLELAKSSLLAGNIQKSEVLAVGVAAPGISEQSTGKNLLFPFIPSWAEVPIHAILQDEFGAPVVVENDVDMAVIGERTWGAGKGCNDLVFLNIAVGVAAGIILDGRLVRGRNAAAGEVGFMVVDPSLAREEFDDQGVLESLISGPGIVRQWMQLRSKAATTETASMPLEPAGASSFQPPEIDSETIFAMAEKGDPVAGQVIARTVSYLSLALANLVAVLNPEKVILGGGVGLALYTRKEALMEFLRRHVPFPPEIVHAQLGSDASVFGAVAVALERATMSLEERLADGIDNGHEKGQAPRLREA
ncbi:MAG TPA: ROK family protein [Firmicutes bacterium]|nr:ROK family protein [Bacillota bacterium]